MRRGSQGVTLCLLAVLLLLPLQAVAVSLGDLTVRSVPGQPLRAHIPFTLLPGETLAEVHVTLASAEEYQKRKLSRVALLEGTAIALQDRGEGRGRVQLFAGQPWQGDAVELLLLVSWDKGQMERHYQLAAVKPAAETTPVNVEVAQDESLDEIAIRLSKGRNRSYLHMMYALFLANPDAFYGGNMNNLKSGRTLRVPSNEELYKLSDREVFDGIRQQYEAWQQLREPRQQRGTRAGEALAGMSAEQTEALDLSGDADALQAQLNQVASDSEALRKENEELRARLQALEQRMQNVAGQVLEYAGDGVPPTPLAPPAQPVQQEQKQPEPEAALVTESESEGEEEADGGLSGLTMFFAIVLVLLFVFYIIYSTGRPQRGRS